MLSANSPEFVWFSGLVFTLLPVIDCAGTMGRALDMIAAPLSDRTVALYGSATFVCNVTKSSSTYWKNNKFCSIDFKQWTIAKNPDPQWNITYPGYPHDHTGLHTLTFNKVRMDHAGKVFCLAKPPRGSTPSEVWAWLNVVNNQINRKEVSPENVRIVAGNPVNLTCYIKGDNSLPYVTWYHNSVKMDQEYCANNHFQLTNETGRSVLLFEAVAADHQTNFTCKVLNSTAGTGNDDQSVIVELPPIRLNVKAPRRKPWIVGAQRGSVTMFAGGGDKIQCTTHSAVVPLQMTFQMAKSSTGPYESLGPGILALTGPRSANTTFYLNDTLDHRYNGHWIKCRLWADDGGKADGKETSVKLDLLFGPTNARIDAPDVMLREHLPKVVCHSDESNPGAHMSWSLENGQLVAPQRPMEHRGKYGATTTSATIQIRADRNATTVTVHCQAHNPLANRTARASRIITVSPVLTAVEPADQGETTSTRVGRPLQTIVHDGQTTTGSVPLSSETTAASSALLAESSTARVTSVVGAVTLQSVRVQGGVVRGVTAARPAVEAVKKVAILASSPYLPEWLLITIATVSVVVVFFSACFVTMLVLEKTCPNRRRRFVNQGTPAPSSTINTTTASGRKAARNQKPKLDTVPSTMQRRCLLSLQSAF
ncbi:uncharacterized protein LOC129595134 [Paramacrobiotus metropolitanus]|uniref:uncharacterized protein LOC129595134 n=1 Tax=Paramacrobiotus metropolitanus TaxID=2943436 RepID=UPI002445E269|nr:uncharacterized protein LOC129595134 [Paramacrobiotus metropolitanus]XP_055348025.1 uncharacterized protein LOC129595134 [Paramacrobiotus metropolitanus]